MAAINDGQTQWGGPGTTCIAKYNFTGIKHCVRPENHACKMPSPLLHFSVLSIFVPIFTLSFNDFYDLLLCRTYRLAKVIS